MGVHTNLLKFLFRTMRYMPFLLLFCLYSPISALPVLNAQDANVAAANTADPAAVSTAADNATAVAAPATGDEAKAKADCTCPTKEPSSETPKSDAVQASPQSADNSIAVNGQPFQAVSPAVRRKRQVPEAPAASVAVVPPAPAVPVVTSLNIAPVAVSEGDLQAAAVAQESSSPKLECSCPSPETLQSAAVAANPEYMKAPEPALAPVYPSPATTTTVAAPVDPYNQTPVVNPDLQAYAVAVDPNQLQIRPQTFKQLRLLQNFKQWLLLQILNRLKPQLPHLLTCKLLLLLQSLKLLMMVRALKLLLKAQKVPQIFRQLQLLQTLKLL